MGVYFWEPHRSAVALWRDITTFFGYFIFFRGNKSLNHIAIGYSGNNSKSFSDVMNEYADKYPVFVKCDIEGWEYRILDDLVANSENICGMVIEFHNVDLHCDRIEKFIDQFLLELVHIHPNNYGGVDISGDPLSIELSFARNPINPTGVCTFPNAADSPNNPNVDDIALRFES